jgi:hypothetical protein
MQVTKGIFFLHHAMEMAFDESLASLSSDTLNADCCSSLTIAFIIPNLDTTLKYDLAIIKVETIWFVFGALKGILNQFDVVVDISTCFRRHE